MSCKHFECNMSASCIMPSSHCEKCVVATDCSRCMNRMRLGCLYGKVVEFNVPKKK